MTEWVAVVWEPAAGALASLHAAPGVEAVRTRTRLADQGRHQDNDSIDLLVEGRSPLDDGLRHRVTALGARVWWFAVRRFVVATPDGPTPVTMVALPRRRRDLTHETFVEHWTQRHAPLAVRHHGVQGYTQLEVVSVLAGGEDAQRVDGISILAFGTREDYDERFYVSESSRATISADVARFIEAPGPETTLMTSPAVCAGYNRPAR